jgi:hypothetical protein
MNFKRVRSGSIKNIESARVSLVGQLRKVDNTQRSYLDGDQDALLVQNVNDLSHAVMQTEIAEEDESAAVEANDSANKSAEADQLEFKLPVSVILVLFWSVSKQTVEFNYEFFEETKRKVRVAH